LCTVTLHCTYYSHYWGRHIIRYACLLYIDIEVESGTPTLVHVIPSTCAVSVGSMAIHGNQLFVGREGAARVDVYDTTTFSIQRSVSITGLGTLVYGLATCDVNNCLYVSDYNNNSVHKFDLSTYNVVLKWKVANGPRGLSVNTTHNVLVTCFTAMKIQEYTTVGALVRQVSISDSSPWHAIQLPSGQLVVSQCLPLHRVSVVGLDGRVIRSYGNKRGPWDNPNDMALYGKQGGVLVADCGNNRIMALNSSLSDARQLPLSVDGGVRRPWCLCLDESRGRLIVGEYGGQGRVLVFDNVVNIDALFK